MKNSINEIRRLILENTDSNERKIKGIWSIDYFHTPVPNQTFDLKLILTQTLGQGCAYSPIKNLDRNIIKNLIDCDVLRGKEYRGTDFSVVVSVLDSLFEKCKIGSSNPIMVNNNSNPIEKNEWRTRIIVDEVHRLLGKESKNKSILNIGVVTSFMENLRKEGYDIFGTDLDEFVVNREVAGTIIKNGEKSPYLSKNVDLVIATGMTITTKTIDKIIEACNKAGTKLIIFSETGHNFASYYIKNGVDSYVSEKFPFYSMYGLSEIKIYRS